MIIREKKLPEENQLQINKYRKNRGINYEACLTNYVKHNYILANLYNIVHISLD